MNPTTSGEEMVVRIFAKDREKFDFYINIYNDEKKWVGRSVVIDNEFENDSYCGDLTVPVIGGMHWTESFWKQSKIIRLQIAKRKK